MKKAPDIGEYYGAHANGPLTVSEAKRGRLHFTPKETLVIKRLQSYSFFCYPPNNDLIPRVIFINICII